jgi:hypothetical protein
MLLIFNKKSKYLGIDKKNFGITKVFYLLYVIHFTAHICAVCASVIATESSLAFSFLFCHISSLRISIISAYNFFNFCTFSSQLGLKVSQTANSQYDKLCASI